MEGSDELRFRSSWFDEHNGVVEAGRRITVQRVAGGPEVAGSGQPDGAQPLQQPGPPIYFSGLKDPQRSAKRIAKYGLQGWIGIQDSPEDIRRWRWLSRPRPSRSRR